MIRRRCCLSVLGLALLSAGCAEPPEVDVPEEEPEAAARAAIDELREDWVTHYNLHHPDMVADFYTDDAFLLNADLSFVEGRDAVEAYHRESMEPSPTVEVDMEHLEVFDDQAVGMGTYSVTLTGPEGEPLTVSGAYMTLLRQVDGEWRIAGRIGNYDSPMLQDWHWADPGEAPPEGSAMTELIQEYETHWNLQHPDMVADLYTEDAVVAFDGGPILQGRQAVERALRESMEELPSTLDVHGVDTVELAEGFALDGGWYEIFPADDDERVQWGMYMTLVERVDDGEWKIRWAVTNGRPADGT